MDEDDSIGGGITSAGIAIGTGFAIGMFVLAWGIGDGLRRTDAATICIEAAQAKKFVSEQCTKLIERKP